MEDKIYEEFNDISFDEAQFEAMEESLTELEIKKLKNNIRKKVYKSNRKHVKLAASIALTAIVGITFVTPVFAKTIGLYIPVMDALYEKLGYYKEYKDFSQYIGVSKEDKGYKFTIDKLVADDDTVLIALRINKQGLNDKSNESDEKVDFMMTADLSGVRRGTIMGGGVEEKELDENTSMVLLESQTGPGKSLPKRFNIWVNIHSTFDGNVNVKFDLPVSREKIQKETVVKKNLGQSSIEDKLKVNLLELKVSPIDTSIEYSFKGKLENSPLIDFYAYDDKGRIYVENSGMSDDSGYNMSYINRIEKDAKKLYIIPYIKLGDQAADKFKNLDFYDKKFSLDTLREFDFKEDGKVNVYKIEKNDKSIKVYYSLKGAQNILDKNQIINLWEIDGDNQGKESWIRTRDMKLYKPDANEPDNYCTEFSNVDASKNYIYSVGSYPILKTIEGTPIEVELR